MLERCDLYASLSPRRVLGTSPEIHSFKIRIEKATVTLLGPRLPHSRNQNIPIINS